MIHYRTPLNSKSFSDIPVDVLKSGIQKYLRHREKDKMIWCMEELFLFGILGQTDAEKKTGKAIVSNLINRIIVMMDEELSFRECEKYLLIRKYLENFENKNDMGDFDKAAEDLRLATRQLGMIVGKVDVEEILGSIFSDFCIGK